MRMQDVVGAVDRATAGKKVSVATGVGIHQSIVARHFRFDYPDRMLLTSCGHGTMGSGLPYLIGAWLERQDSIPILFTGDGSFLIESPGMATLVEQGIPAKIFVLDNGSFGIVRQYEKLNGIRPIATRRPRIDWLSVAEAYGIPSVEFEENGDWERQVARMCVLKGPWLMQIPVSDIGVWPILESGHWPEMTDGAD